MSSRDDNSIPYIERAPGDLLTAEVWNQLQKDVKTHINDVKAIATDSEVDIVSISVDDGVTFGDDSKQIVAAPLDADGKVNALADGTVTTDTITDGSITASKMAPGVIPTDLLSDGSVTEVKIAENAVTESKIADGSITASKMAPGVIPTDVLSDGSVTAIKIADDAVTSDKIANHAVGTNQIASNAIHGAQIAESSSVEVRDLTVTRSISAPGIGIPAGSMMPFAGVKVPEGWLACDGETYNAKDYPRLFSVIETGYGDGTVGKDGKKIKEPFPTMPKEKDDIFKDVFKEAGAKEMFGDNMLDEKIPSGKTFEESLLDDKIIDDKLDDTIKDAIRVAAFNVPDMRGMFMRGWDNGAGRDKEAPERKPSKEGGAGGDAIGSIQDHAMEEHAHTVALNRFGAPTGSYRDRFPGFDETTDERTTSNQITGNQGLETRPMNIYVNYIIKT